MVGSKQVRAALRKLRTDANLTPEEFADGAAVGRATVYRIEDLEKPYTPRIETVSALVESRDLTLSSFFARIEGGPTQVPSGTLVMDSTPVESAANQASVSRALPGAPLSDRFVNEAVIIGIAERLADRFTSAIGIAFDKLAESRRQDATARPDATVRPQRDRKSRRSNTGR